MSDADIVERSLERAAEQFGDITPLVYDYLFREYPDAEACFSLKGEQYKAALMGRMVTDTLYSFIEHLNSAEEVELFFKYTIPQHLDLGIPMMFFVGLLEAVAVVVQRAAPAEEAEAVAACWQRLVTELAAAADTIAQQQPTMAAPSAD